MQIKNLKPKLLFYVANDSQATSPRSALSCDVIAKIQHVQKYNTLNVFQNSVQIHLKH